MKRLHRTRAFTLVELLVVIGIIALLISILLPSLNRARETANRVKCAANLKSIGLSMIQYASDNRGSFPRTRATGGVYQSSFKVTWGSGPYQPVVAPADPFNNIAQRPAENDVTAALFRLLTTMDITAQSFICPSSNAEAWDYGGGINTQFNWVNWNGPSAPLTMTQSGQGTYKNLAYSVQCPYADDTSTFKWSPNLGSDFAIAADMNPGTPGQKGMGTSAGGGVGAGQADDVTSVLPTGSQKQGNSSNHQKDGQNVLYADGHVDFVQSCFAGPNGDNIYARKKTSQSQKKESDGDEPWGGSVDQSDSVLLPMD